MKKDLKNYSLATTLLTTFLLIVFAINVAYAYFSSTKSVEGSGSLADFGVKICYQKTDDPDDLTVYTTNDSTITLVPNSAVSRNTPFTFKVNGEEYNATLGFTQSNENTTEAYVRFWLEAYVDGDSTTDYGPYLEAQMVNGFTYAEKVSDSKTTYFLVDPLDVDSSQIFISTITLLSTAPIEMLNTTVTIKLSFEACQASNEAFRSVFNDDRGYYSDWE